MCQCYLLPSVLYCVVSVAKSLAKTWKTCSTKAGAPIACIQSNTMLDWGKGVSSSSVMYQAPLKVTLLLADSRQFSFV